MPKNKKPAGGRPAKNFDPSYAKGGSKGGPARAGSVQARLAQRRPPRLPPRGADAPRKVRWSRDERVAAGRTPHRTVREGRDDRAPRDDATTRARRSYDRNDRAPRSYDRDDRRAPAPATATIARLVRTTATTVRPARTTATTVRPVRTTATTVRLARRP